MKKIIVSPNIRTTIESTAFYQSILEKQKSIELTQLIDKILKIFLIWQSIKTPLHQAIAKKVTEITGFQKGDIFDNTMFNSKYEKTETSLLQKDVDALSELFKDKESALAAVNEIINS